MGKNVVLLFLLILPIITSAQSNLLLMPKRLVFEARTRVQVLNLANAGEDTLKYVITVAEMEMGEEGDFREVPDTVSVAHSIKKHLKVFPRTVILGPGESQVVKVQLLNASKMEKGEYRSHLRFQPLKEKKKFDKDFKIVTLMNFSMVPVFSFTVPVIVRIGDYNVNLRVEDLSFSMVGDTIPVLSGAFKRSGPMSVYGNVSVDHLTPEGKATHIAMAKGVAIYAPNEVRKFKMSLNNKMGVDYTKGKLKILFTTEVEERQVKLTETFLNLSQ
jgi:hypothetical protein